MPKKTRKTKAKKIKKIVRKAVAKKTKKPAKKKTAAKRKTASTKVKPVKKPAAGKSAATAKPSRPPAMKKAPSVPMVAEQRVGIVTHYYSHLNVAVVKLDQGALQVGDSIHIKGHTTDFQQRVDSMQIEHQSIQRADLGQEFGLKVSEHVREHDVVYKMLG